MKKIKKFTLLVVSLVVFASSVYAVQMARKNGFVSGYTDSNITYHYVGYQIIGESPVREFHGLSWTECYRLMNYYYWAESYQYCQDDGTCQLYVTPITNPEDFL